MLHIIKVFENDGPSEYVVVEASSLPQAMKHVGDVYGDDVNLESTTLYEEFRGIALLNDISNRLL